MNVKMEHRARRAHGAKKKESKESKDDKIIILVNGEDDDDPMNSVRTLKLENSTQTRIGARGKANCIPLEDINKCLTSGMKQICPRHKLKRKKKYGDSGKCVNPKYKQWLLCKHSYKFTLNTKIMDWKKYHRLSVINSFVEDLERDFPAICTVSVIGKSIEGRSIKISNSNATNTPVWLDGAIHPREWITTAVVTYIADYIVRNFHDLSEHLTNKDWYIVPVLNPDGYEYTHTHDRMWRKNRAIYDGHCVGVDLNRNFSYGWGHNGEEGSSDTPENVFYRGPAPFSEPETAAVRDFILGSPTPFKVFLSFHSYFELIIFPWGYKKDPCPDYLNLMEAGIRMARAIHKSSGMTYKVGSTKDLTYYACGTATDWSYSVAKIPYSFMIELPSKKNKFKLPRDKILSTCEESWNGVQSLMEYVDGPSYLRKKK
ncbi:carboxypeptidase B-like isoform X2 [Choristoneura fumiferana]|uniref:carboxypeptidase B-like isoform X2 n=1 Tax=Choristoneura fumiferana TaxID=7141 RepID=UPI003D15AEC4